ncbi:MAG: hypothetical protein R3E50_06210 [Halioglobus sp.]
MASYLRGKIETRDRTGPRARLAALAAEVRGMGECPADTLLAHCAVELATDAAAALRALESCLANSPVIDHPGWRRFLEDFRAQAQAALVAPRTSAGDDVVRWLPSFQEAAVSFAEALECWIPIREASARIAQGLLAAPGMTP